MRERSGSAAISGSRSAGSDCQTRSDSPSCSWIRPKIEAAPSQPSLSWIAATPRAFATRMPSRVASTHSSSVTVTKRSRKRQADSSRRIPVGSPSGAALDDAARLVEIAAGAGEAGRVEPERVVVLRPQGRRRLSGDRVERGSGRRPPPRPRPASRCRGSSFTAAWVRRDERQRRRQRVRLLEADVVARERPRREVDVRVGERRQHAAAGEVDPLGRRQRPLVGADAAGDERPRDRERTAGRQRRVERADDAVVEDHAGSTAGSSRRCSDRARRRRPGPCSRGEVPRAAGAGPTSGRGTP